MSRLRVASVCSGIGGAELAFDDAVHVFASEIEAFPRAVLQHHFPGLKLYGDFTAIPASAGPVDVLVGGTPCQSFSVAGLRGGLADERGNLALEYLRLADRLKPAWMVWENVPGVLSSNDGRDFGAFVGGLAELGYGWAYRSFDAQYWGLAQRRQRVFVVGCLGDWRRAVAVLFEPACLRGYPAPGREAGQRAARPLAAGSPGGSGYRNDADTADSLIAMCLNAHAGRIDAESETFIAYDVTGVPATNGARATDVHTALRSRAPGHSEASTTTVIATVHDDPRRFDARGVHGGGDHGELHPPLNTVNSQHIACITHSLRADGFDASEDGTGRGTPLVAVDARNGTQGNVAMTLQSSGTDRGFSFNCLPLAAVAFHEDQHGNVYSSAVTSALSSGGGKPGQGYPAVAFQQNQRDEVREMPVAGSIQARHGMKQQNYIASSLVRRLTPTECERLQGFPDGWTAIEYRGKHASDGARYRALGNAFAIPVVRWIARRIAREHADIAPLAEAAD